MIRICGSLIILLLVSVQSLSAQHFNNLDFNKKCDSSKTGLCAWELSWGSKHSAQPVIKDGRYALLISGRNEKSVTFVEQSANVALDQVQILTVSALIKGDSIIGKGAGLNIGLYDAQDGLVANKDMGGYYSINWIRELQDWKNFKISIVIPTEVVKIKIGMILYGQGKAWFSNYNVEQSSLENRMPSDLATRYINAACDTIAKHSLYRDSIDITDLRATALKIAGPAKHYDDCYLAINYLLECLRPYGDNHSYFMTAEESVNWENEGSQVLEIQAPSIKLLDNIGYLYVPPFHGGNPQQMQAYADSLQSAIAQLFSKQIIGWVVDLRENTGGNMEPMIAGLGPLFNQSKLGALIDVNDRFDYWYYENGKYYWDSVDGMTVSNPFKPATSLPIAVLTSSQTGSSGEIVVISFIGNTRTKSFGQPTWGLTTGNGDFRLADGAKILLASTVMADRNDNRYDSSIHPDHFIEDDPSTEVDEVLSAAIKWIRTTK